MKLSIMEYDGRDCAMVKWQIKAKHDIIGGVLDRCVFGHPRVILLNPRNEHGEDTERNVFNYDAIANVIWLTCPYLNYRIHQIEAAGFIKKISSFISDDRTIKAIMERAHAHFYFFRKKAYNHFFDFPPPAKRIELFNSGIGGVEDASWLKCLHSHFAHYRICPENVVGMMISRMLYEQINCKEELCRNA